MKQYKKLMMTLALLLTAATGAWAQEPEITVTPAEAANTWTFAMPTSDVVLTPLYAPAAAFSIVENVEQLPAAVSGIVAGTTNAIVTAGQTEQGTPMYAATTTNTTAPALSAFSADLPTAAILTGSVAQEQTVYVWYYIKGQDTPQGQEATADNTFNDSEILGPIAVTLQPNVFTLTLSPAPVTKATVTIDDQAATPDENGKIADVKANSSVKLNAKEGYKFRKVEVKKTPKE